MKRVGIDARLISQTGIGVYLSNLLYYLDKSNPKKYQIYVYLLKKDFNKVVFKSKNIVKRVGDYKWHGFSEQGQFLKMLNADNLDLMHFTYFSYPIFYRKKFISTIHDLTPLLFKTGKASSKNKTIYNLKYLFMKIVFKSQVENSAAIITPTKTVKNQILKRYGSSYDSKIFPIYEGVNEKIKSSSENKSLKKQFQTSFYIYIGNFYPHKNIERLIRAFVKTQINEQLILAGPEDYFFKKVAKLINQLKATDRIMLFKNPKLKELVFFYKNAKALINPSLSEGFGLPMLEAAYFNCPILGSNIEVFKEILDNSYISFDPYSIEDMTKKISEFNQTRRKINYSKILEKCSFENMTRETINLYNKVISYG